MRATLIAVQQANQTSNYGVLYGLGAPGFQSVNPPERLTAIFAGLRGQNYDLSGVAVLEPQLTLLPELDANNVMRLAGYFPSVPLQVNFDLQFVGLDGRWRLLGIAVNVGPPHADRAPTASPERAGRAALAAISGVGRPGLHPAHASQRTGARWLSCGALPVGRQLR